MEDNFEWYKDGVKAVMKHAQARPPPRASRDAGGHRRPGGRRDRAGRRGRHGRRGGAGRVAPVHHRRTPAGGH
ncbi:MAG: hypothetical protein MZV70_68465 [Desulfobacterales bacterium]|nr:hypothetical protein [Desulfobacterales bacterium]